MRQLISIFALTLTAAACADTPVSKETEALVTKNQALCVKSFQRQRECTSTFIPALVDLRVKLDKPSGIAGIDKAEGRTALVEQAMKEWSEDSKDEAIQSNCE